MEELVHYKIGDNMWVVEGDPDFLRHHLNHGFLEDESGRIICIDPSMLYMCGRLIHKRRFFGRRSNEEVTIAKAWENTVKSLDRCIAKQPTDCPRDKSKCRFWNDVFDVCSIAGNRQAMATENTPCIKTSCP